MYARVTRHRGVFTYADEKIPFYFWAHTEGSAAPDTVIFLGTGQNGRIPKWVAQQSPAGTVAVEGAPHWRSHPSGNDLYEFMASFSAAAFKAVLAEFDLPAANAIAHSQAAPGVVRLALHLPQLVRNVVLASPLGFGVEAFGRTPKERFSTLAKRSVRSLMQIEQSPLHDPRNLYAGLMILRALLAEKERGASRRKYARGLSYDMLEDCRQLLRLQTKTSASLTLLLGKKDKIFIPHETLAIANGTGLQGMRQVIVPGVSHSSLAVRGSRATLQAAVAAARQ